MASNQEVRGSQVLTTAAAPNCAASRYDRRVRRDGRGRDRRHESCTAVPTCTEPFPGEWKKKRKGKKRKKERTFPDLLGYYFVDIITSSNAKTKRQTTLQGRTPPPNCDPRPIRYDTNSWALSHLDPSPSHKLAENQGPRPPVLHCYRATVQFRSRSRFPGSVQFSYDTQYPRIRTDRRPPLSQSLSLPLLIYALRICCQSLAKQ